MRQEKQAVPGTVLLKVWAKKMSSKLGLLDALEAIKPGLGSINYNFIVYTYVHS